MTEKEALECLKEPFKDNRSIDFSIALVKAKEALELQIPKKVRIERGRFTDFYCPCCDCKVGEFSNAPPYCENCGQRLEWSEGDD